MPDNTNRPPQWPNGEVNVPYKSGEMVPLARLLGLGPILCMECGGDDEKQYAYQDGFVYLWCDRCQRETTHQAFHPGDWSQVIGRVVFEDANLIVQVRQGACLITNKISAKQARLRVEFDGFFTLDML